MSISEKKLDIILQTLVEFKGELTDLKGEFQNFKGELTDFKEEFRIFKEETTERLVRIETTVQRLEREQPEDITAMLKQINDKIDRRDTQILVLNNRVFKVETQVEYLSQQ